MLLIPEESVLKKYTRINRTVVKMSFRKRGHSVPESSSKQSGEEDPPKNWYVLEKGHH